MSANLECDFCKLKSRCVIPSIIRIGEEKGFEVNILNLNLKKGQEIIRKGDFVKGIYFLKNGTLKKHYDCGSGPELISKIYNGNEIIALDISLTSDTYPYNITAINDSEVCYLSIQVFKKYLFNDMEVMKSILDQLALEKIKIESKLINNSKKSVRERVISTIMDFSEKFNSNESGYIDLLLSREEIAGLSFTNTESVVRILTELKGDRLIELENKKLKILDLNKLKKFAGICID